MHACNHSTSSGLPKRCPVGKLDAKFTTMSYFIFFIFCLLTDNKNFLQHALTTTFVMCYYQVWEDFCLFLLMQDEYFQVDNSAIKHDGFFVNRGTLERTSVSHIHFLLRSLHNYLDTVSCLLYSYSLHSWV